MQYNTQQMNGIMSRGTETYVLSDAANASIPKEIRDQFPTDDQGRLLVFTQPPLDIQHIVSGSTQAERTRPLEHTEKYMKALAVRKRKLEEEHTVAADVDGELRSSSQPKQAKIGEGSTQSVGNAHKEMSSEEIRERATDLLSEKMKHTTSREYQAQYGDDWRKVLLADLDYQTMCHKKAVDQEQSAAKQREKFNQSHLGKLNGQYSLNPQGYFTGWRKDFFTGSYLDDYDSRLP
jgi:chromatin structure-remodeling complex subunit RSC1/2